MDPANFALSIRQMVMIPLKSKLKEIYIFFFLSQVTLCLTCRKPDFRYKLKRLQLDKVDNLFVKRDSETIVK